MHAVAWTIGDRPGAARSVGPRTIFPALSDRGVITEQKPLLRRLGTRWWGNDQLYLDFGPKQAKIVPFVDVEYKAKAKE